LLLEKFKVGNPGLTILKINMWTRFYFKIPEKIRGLTFSDLGE
jgi:hypothetical protein